MSRVSPEASVEANDTEGQDFPKLIRFLLENRDGDSVPFRGKTNHQQVNALQKDEATQKNETTNRALKKLRLEDIKYGPGKATNQ